MTSDSRVSLGWPVMAVAAVTLVALGAGATFVVVRTKTPRPTAGVSEQAITPAPRSVETPNAVLASAALPDVPSLSEAVPGYEFDTWYGIFVPAKTPGAIISRINTDLVAITAEPEFVKSMAAQGSEARSSTPQALGAMVRSEYDRLGKVMETIGPITQ